MMTNSNTETIKPIRDIRWFWWQWRIRRWRDKAEQLRLLGERYDDRNTVKEMGKCKADIGHIANYVDDLYNRNYKPDRFIYYDKTDTRKLLMLTASLVKCTIIHRARTYQTLFGPFHGTLRIWRHYWFRCNLRHFVKIIESVKTLMRIRELNRELCIGSASKYTQDNDPVIKQYRLFIGKVTLVMRRNYDLYMDRNPYYKTFLGRRLQASYIRKEITILYRISLVLPDPDK